MVFYPDIKAFLIQQHPKMQANGVREDSTPTHFGNRYGLLFVFGWWVGVGELFLFCFMWSQKRGSPSPMASQWYHFLLTPVVVFFTTLSTFWSINMFRYFKFKSLFWTIWIHCTSLGNLNNSISCQLRVLKWSRNYSLVSCSHLGRKCSGQLLPAFALVTSKKMPSVTMSVPCNIILIWYNYNNT